jgi:uncharacterized protein YdhG (YjbR/CyaY superfamily)
MADKNIQDINAIDEYIGSYPVEIQEKMTALREVIKKAAPNSEEKLSWQMPTFAQDGIIVQFAAHKAHIGFYPGPRALEVFRDELSGYKSTKGGVQFPYVKPMPLDAVANITIYNLEANKQRAAEKTNKKKAKRQG